MKLAKSLATLLALTLLLSSIPTSRLWVDQAEAQADLAWAHRRVRSASTLDNAQFADPTTLNRAPLDSARRRRADPSDDRNTPGAIATIQLPAQDWRIECVDCPRQFKRLTDRSVRLDAEGRPHIAYGQDHLYYAWRDGTIWHYETVDGSPGTGGSASLALDSAGRPHISYFHCGMVDFSNTCLQPILGYARYDGDGWHIESVVDEGYSGSNTSLALDSEDRPHISFSGDFTEHLKYAWHDGTSWQVETVDSSRPPQQTADSNLSTTQR